MPAASYNNPDGGGAYHTLRGLESNPDWRLVFFNDRQKLYVDTRTARGKELFDGVFNGQTVYPDDYHRNLIRAYHCRSYRPEIAEKRRGLDFATAAFDLNPSPAPMLEILALGDFRELSSKVDRFCHDYFDNFKKSQDTWAKQDGFRLRVEAARLASIRLKQLAQRRRNIKLVSFYTNKEKEYLERLKNISLSKRW